MKREEFFELMESDFSDLKQKRKEGCKEIYLATRWSMYGVLDEYIRDMKERKNEKGRVFWINEVR